MGSLVMAVKLVLLLLLVGLACGQQDDRRGSARKRLRDLFSRRNNNNQGERKIEVNRVVKPSDLDTNEDDDVIVSVSSSTSESVSFSRKSPSNKKAAVEENNLDVVRETSTPSNQQRFRFRNNNNRNQNSLIEKLLNRMEVNNQVESENRAQERPRKFRPSTRRDQLRKKAETAIEATKKDEKVTRFKLRFRRPNNDQDRNVDKENTSTSQNDIEITTEAFVTNIDRDDATTTTDVKMQAPTKSSFVQQPSRTEGTQFSNFPTNSIETKMESVENQAGATNDDQKNEFETVEDEEIIQQVSTTEFVENEITARPRIVQRKKFKFNPRRTNFIRQKVRPAAAARTTITITTMKPATTETITTTTTLEVLSKKPNLRQNTPRKLNFKPRRTNAFRQESTPAITTTTSTTVRSLVTDIPINLQDNVIQQTINDKTVLNKESFLSQTIIKDPILASVQRNNFDVINQLQKLSVTKPKSNILPAFINQIEINKQSKQKEPVLR